MFIYSSHKVGLEVLTFFSSHASEIYSGTNRMIEETRAMLMWLKMNLIFLEGWLPG